MGCHLTSRLTATVAVIAALLTPPARATQPAKQASRRALLVGVTRYQAAGWNNLRFPHKDARDLQATLLDPAIGAWRADDVSLLTDAEATRDRLVESIDRLLKGAQPDDFVVFFFSGHGLRSGSDVYLMMHDTDPEKPAVRGVEVAWLRRKFNENAEGANKLVILDACHSGAAAGADKGGGVEADALVGALSGAGGGAAWITSSGGYEKSAEGANNGLFTAAFLAALRGGDRKPGSTVTLSDVWSFVTRQVSGQHPQARFDSIPTDIPLALRAGGAAPPAQTEPPNDPGIERLRLEVERERKLSVEREKQRLNAELERLRQPSAQSPTPVGHRVPAQSSPLPVATARPRPADASTSLPVGTEVVVKVDSALAPDTARIGESWQGSLVREVTIESWDARLAATAMRPVAAAGGRVSGRIEFVNRVEGLGHAKVGLSVVGIEIDGELHPVRTNNQTVNGQSGQPLRLGHLTFRLVEPLSLPVSITHEQAP